MEQKFLRLRDVALTTGLSRSSIYRLAELGMFPTPVRLGARASGWVTSEIQDWCDARVRQSRGTAGALV
jgi:prophage regulatory protein